MPLPIGAGNSVNSIPFALQNNAARPSARDARYSSAKTLTSDQISDQHLALFMAADHDEMIGSSNELEWLPYTRVVHSSPMRDMWTSVMEKGNPEGKTLQDITLMLKTNFRHANAHEGCTVMLMTTRGQVTMTSGFWGRIRISSHAVNNYQEFKKEKFHGFTDALTLSVMRALYKPSLIDNFLSRRGVVMSNK